MKRLYWFIVLLLVSSILISCSQPTETLMPSDEMINLGDEIDGMVFTTDDEQDMYITINAYCGWDPKEVIDTTYNFECAASPGDPIFFGNCIAVAVDPSEDLDDAWKKLKNAKMTFDGKDVNISSFGSLDFTAWEGSKARSWNVMVESISPGTHTLQCRHEYEDVAYESNWVITVPDETETYPKLSAAVVPGHQPFTSEKAKLNYFIYIPDEYGSESQEKWPLILSLHGLDQGVMNSMELLEESLLTPPENWDDFPFIIVSPQGKGEYEFWSTEEMISALMTLLDEIKDSLAVDSNRIYLTGFSAGGNGTWTLGLRHPDTFAALVPAAGYYGWPFEVPENICDLADVPVWAFHGAKDEVLPLDGQQMLVDALESCGGDVQFTVYPDADHEIFELVYTEELFTWLLSQSLK
jgi:predicted esterase